MRIGRTLPPAASPIGWTYLLAGLVRLLRGQREVERFTNGLTAYFDKRHCFLVSSGKAALTLILLALKEQYPKRNEVIIPAYTCYSVPSAIVRAGLKIKPCDLAEKGFDFEGYKIYRSTESNFLENKVLILISNSLVPCLKVKNCWQYYRPICLDCQQTSSVL